MAKATFTPAQKAQAIILLNKGKHASDVIEEIGCSMASLQNWKKDYKEGKIHLNDVKGSHLEKEEEEEDDYTPASSKSHTTSRPKESLEEFIEQYWYTVSVNTVKEMPDTIDDVIKLVEDALKYAYKVLGR